MHDLATTADLSFFRTIDKMHTQSISASHIRAVKILSSSPLHNKAAFLSRRIDVERICQGFPWFCWTSALLWIHILFKLFAHEYSFLLPFAHSFTGFFHSFIHSLHSFLTYPILRQVDNLFQTQFSTECNQSASFFKLQYLLFPYSHSVGSYVFFIVFPSLLSFHEQRVLEGRSYANVTYPVSIPYFLNLAYSFPRWPYFILLHFYTRIMLHLNYSFYIYVLLC